jgi:uncharacterized damage-inducible protein DinB
MTPILLRILSLARERTLAAALDLPDEYLALQPAGARNHPAWTLGHLLFVESRGAAALGLRPELPAGWEERFASGTTPTGDRARYPLKAELLDRLGGLRLALLGKVETLSAADLERMAPSSPVLGRCATMGDVLTYLAWHEGYHNGQLAVWRRAAGIGQTAVE